MPLSKEEAALRGYEIRPIKHSMKRRAEWNDYFMPGRYGVTVHLWSDEEGRINPTTKLSDIVGTCKERNVGVEVTEVGMIVARKIGQIGNHPNYQGVRCIHSVIMPTHIHLTIELEKQLPVVQHGGKPLQLTLGHLVGALKGGCTSLFKHLCKGHFADCTPGSEEWARRCDFEYSEWKAFLGENPHLGHNANPHLHEGNRSDGECYLHVSEGQMTSEGNMGGVGATGYSTPAGSATIPPSLWEEGFNDKILNTTRKVEEWIYYEDMNPWFWKLESENPKLMQRRLHIDIAMRDDGEVVDFSAFGCIFLLRKGERIQVQCTRLAEKGMLTEEEWRYFSQPEQVRKFEAERKVNSLGYWDRRWLYNTDARCKTPIPYELTEHFKKYKEGILTQVRNGVIPVSPAVSKGEQEIFYTAADEGYPVIKLSKTLFTARKHPGKRDRVLCSKGLMLVLGPWELASRDLHSREGNSAGFHSHEGNMVGSDRAIFKDLNLLAERMCGAIGSMNLKEQLEEFEGFNGNN